MSLFSGDRRADGLKRGTGYGSTAKEEAERKRLADRKNGFAPKEPEPYGAEGVDTGQMSDAHGIENAGRRLPDGWEVQPGADLTDHTQKRPSWAKKNFYVLDDVTNPVGEGDTEQAAIEDAFKKASPHHQGRFKNAVENGYTKRAWVRDEGTPQGKPGSGRISCPCGKAPVNVYADGKDVDCPCGRKYDSRGNILAGPELSNDAGGTGGAVSSSATGFQSGEKTTTAHREDYPEIPKERQNSGAARGAVRYSGRGLRNAGPLRNDADPNQQPWSKEMEGVQNAKPGVCECDHSYEDHGPEDNGFLPCRKCKCSSYHKTIANADPANFCDACDSNPCKCGLKNGYKIKALCEECAKKAGSSAKPTGKMAGAGIDKCDSCGKGGQLTMMQLENSLDNAMPLSGSTCPDCERGKLRLVVSKSSDGRERYKCDVCAATFSEKIDERKNSGHLDAPDWELTDETARLGWLEAAGLDVSMASLRWPELSEDAKVALQKAWDYSASQNNGNAAAAAAKGLRADSGELVEPLLNATDDEPRWQKEGKAWALALGKADSNNLKYDSKYELLPLAQQSDYIKQKFGERKNTTDPQKKSQLRGESLLLTAKVQKLDKRIRELEVAEKDAIRMRDAETARELRAEISSLNAEWREGTDKLRTMETELRNIDDGGEMQAITEGGDSLENALSAPWKCDVCGADLATDEDVKSHKFDTGHSSYKGKSKENATRADLKKWKAAYDALLDKMKPLTAKMHSLKEQHGLPGTSRGQEPKGPAEYVEIMKQLEELERQEQKMLAERPVELDNAAPHLNSYTFADNVGAEEKVEAKNEDEAWSLLSARMNDTPKAEMCSMGVHLKNVDAPAVPSAPEAEKPAPKPESKPAPKPDASVTVDSDKGSTKQGESMENSKEVGLKRGSNKYGTAKPKVTIRQNAKQQEFKVSLNNDQLAPVFLDESILFENVREFLISSEGYDSRIKVAKAA